MLSILINLIHIVTRYINNVFIIWNKNKESLDSSLDNAIKFTLEIKENQNLSFSGCQANQR